MYKKLIKYGNSNALILDRAILELLNIDEGATVKLTTDGKSLTITPAEKEQPMHIYTTGMEILNHYNEKKHAEIEADPVKKQEWQKWQPGGENFPKLYKEMTPIIIKYSEDAQKLTCKDFMHECEELVLKYQNNLESKEYLEEYLAIRRKYAPSLDAMDKEIREMRKKLGAPDTYITM